VSEIPFSNAKEIMPSNRVLLEKLIVTKKVIIVNTRGNLELHTGYDDTNLHSPPKKILKQVANVISHIQCSRLNKSVICFSPIRATSPAIHLRLYFTILIVCRADPTGRAA
jgi:hypothetical protein